MIEKIEAIVNDERDFEKLKPYADYYSELTHVMSFPLSVIDKGLPEIEKYFTKEYLTEKHQEDCKYVIDFDVNSYKFLLITPDSYIDFVGGVRAKDAKIGIAKLESLKFIYILLKYNLVKMGDGFREYFSPLDKDCKLSDLKTFKSKVNFRGKRWSFEKYFKENIENGKFKFKDIDSIKVVNSGLFNVKYTKIPNYKEVRIIIDDVNKKDKKCLGHSVSNNNEMYEIQRYGWAPFHLSCWQEGKEVRILTKAVYGDYNDENNSYRKIISPILLPEDIIIDNIDEFSVNLASLTCGKYPVKLLNEMYFEYKIRTLF